MPTTVNGIGTTYYGKKNLRVHHAQCEFCHRAVELKEYETIHWIVVFYIPVIPLGRKQILDQCPACRQHRVLPLAKWDELREKTIEEKTEAFAKNQDDPQAALELVEALATFSRFDEAEKLAEGIQHRFDDDAQVQFHMGQWHEFRNRRAEAAECFRRALQLQGDNLEAKRAVAACMMSDDQVEQALALIKSAPEITPQDDPGLYVELGQSFGRLGQHGDALVAFRQALEVVPELKADKEFQKLVRTSEKSDPAGTTILPRTPFYRTGRAIVAAAVVGIVALVLFANFYISRHRTLHLVNGFDVPVELALDDRGAITIGPHSWQTSPIAEGRHRAVVTAGGKSLGNDEFDVASSFWRRWFDDPVFVLNAGGGAAIVWEQAVYANPPIDGGSTRVEAGTRFVTFDDVDYPFAQFPQTIEAEGGKPVTRTRVDLVVMPVEQVFYLQDAVAPEAQLAFAETHLAFAPENKAILQAYLRAAAGYGQLDRAREFLETGLDAVPVRVEWHRGAQQLAQTEDQNESLRRRYRQWLEKDPNNSSILYLMGRLEPHTSAALVYLDSAIAADPQNPYPWYAKGFHLCAGGDFPAAKIAYEKAVELRPDDEDFRRGLRDAWLALGQFADLEREARTRLREEPHEFVWHIQLLEVLAAQNKLGQAMAANAQYAKALNALPETGDDVQQAIEIVEIMLWYLQQDFRRILKHSDRSPDEFAFLRYQCHLELGMYDDAAADLELAGNPPDPFNELQLSVGWRMSGDERKADAWQNRACEQFEQGLAQQRQIASLLRGAAGATLEAAHDVTLQPHEKTIVLIALAQQSGDHEDELLALAEKLNYSRKFPYYFNERAIAAARKKK